MLIRIAICDDEIGTCSDIESMILNYAKLQALQIDTEVFYSGETLFKAMENKDKYGLIFLDIQLLQLDGVQVGKQIREQLGNEKISIVYISSKETYAMSLFQIRPLDFLIKPITQKNVNETIDKYIRLNSLMKNDFFFHGDKEAALKYLSDMGAFMDSTEEFVTSGNERIDSILNYMIEKAQNANIHTSWKVQIPEQIEISTFDINVILSNLLDNALNALADSPNPALEILMKYDRGLLCINIQNNCSHRQAATHNIHSVLEAESEH